MVPQWCLHYELGHGSAGFGPKASAVMIICSWQVPVWIPAHMSPPPRLSFQDPGRESRLLSPPHWLVPRRILVFLPNAQSQILRSVLEMLPAGAAHGSPARAELCWGWRGGWARPVDRLRGGPGPGARRFPPRLLPLPVPLWEVAGERGWHPGPEAQRRGSGLFP